MSGPLGREATEESMNREALLHEYQVTSTRVDNLTSLIWQTLTVFLGLSGLGLGVLARTEIDTPDQILLAFVVAIAVTFTLRWWNKAANKWSDNQDAMYARLQEIEGILHLRTNLSINERDQERKDKGARIITIRGMRNELVLGVSLGWNIYVVSIGFLAYLEGKNNSRGNTLEMEGWAAILVSVISLLLVVVFFAEYLRKKSKETQKVNSAPT